MTTQPMTPDDPMRHSGARWCDDHDRWECSRQRSKGRGDCHQPAMRGMDRCRNHMGFATSVARAEGAANMAAWSVLAAMDLPARDPGTVMLAALEMSIMRVQCLGELLRLQVEDEDYNGLIGKTRAAGRDGGSVESGEQYRGLAKLERDERILMVDIAKKAHDMGIAERVIELHQGQAQLVVTAFMAGLSALPGLLPVDRDAALRAFLAGLGRGPEQLEVGAVTA